MRPVARGAAAFTFGEQPRLHRRANLFEARHHERIEVEVERVAEGRDEDDGAGGAGLMTVEHELRTDRKRAGWGKRGLVRVDSGGRRILKKKKHTINKYSKRQTRR